MSAHRVLVVEDDPIRRGHFAKELADYEVAFASDIAEARRRLEGESFALLFLDHDLEGGRRVYIDPEEPGTGYQLAREMARDPRYSRTPVIVHSFNWFGANKILRVLPSALYVPFGLYPLDLLARMFLEDGLDASLDNLSEVLRRRTPPKGEET